MNKKFSTLLASFLLAGGLFSTTNAEYLSKVKAGQFVKLEYSHVYGSNQKWNAPNNSGLFLAVEGLSKDAYDLWKVVKVEGGYNLVNFDDEKFTFEESSLFTFNENDKDATQLSYASDKYVAVKNVDGTLKLVKQEGSSLESGAYSMLFDAEETNLEAIALQSEMADGLVFQFVVNNEGKEVSSDIYVATLDAKKKDTYSFAKNSDGSALYIADAEGKTDNDFVVINTPNGALLQALSGKYVAFDGEFSLVEALEDASLFAFNEAGFVLVKESQLNDFGNGDFSVTVLYKDAKGKFTKTDIAGNPFTGTLVATDGNTDTDNTVFQIRKTISNVTYVVVAKKYEGQGAAASQALYDFTTIKLSDYNTHTSRVAQGLETQIYFADFRGYISEEDLDENGRKIKGVEKLEVKVAKVNNQEWANVGRYDLNSVPTLLASLTTDLYPIYVKMGSHNLVAPKDLLVKGKFYTVEKYNKTPKVWEHLVTVKNDDVQYNHSQYTNVFGNVLESQFALTLNEDDQYVFTNRESGNADLKLDINSLYYSGTENVYECGSDLYRIKTVAEHAATDGYTTLDVTETTTFNIAYASGVYGNAWFTENHSDRNVNDHIIGLDINKENALTFKATEYAAPAKYKETANANEYTPTDVIYVISTLGYINADGDYKTTVDTLKIVSYSFVNQYGEPLVKNGDKYVCNGNYSEGNKFALRLDNGKLNLRTVNSWRGVQIENATSEFDHTKNYQIFDSYIKMYAGDAANGILNTTSLYHRTENDLFVIEATEAPVYRRLVNAIDTVSIYRDENASQLLYEETTEYANFLNLKNENQFEIAPAMLADTAYVRNETYKPLYMLAVDATIVPDGKYCPIHGVDATCEHASETKGWVEGRYLVCLEDSAKAWDEGKHNTITNPYEYDGMYKLGFVPAIHKNDSLIITHEDEKKVTRFFLGKGAMNPATFAFRYVDEEAGSFLIETACYNKDKKDYSTTKYVKWINGNVVLTGDKAEADVFNMNEEEGRTPTANEEIAAEGVTVISGNGQITIAGAAGKKVVIANILGQTVANTVLTSDNATIAAPAGVVVVKVEGEAAVKAIVK